MDYENNILNNKRQEGEEVNSIITSFREEINFNSLIDSMALEYVIVYVQTRMLLEQYFNDTGKKQIFFPIDYFDFAMWIGLKIELTDLNYYRSNKFSRLQGRLQKDENGEYTILLERREPFLSLRYAVCREIAYFLCSCENANCIRVNLPNTWEEIAVDIVASFLMLPPKLTFDVAYEYTKKYEERPVDLNEMFNYLSSCMQIPHYRVVTSYEHLKILACYLNSLPCRTKIMENVNKNVNNEKLKKEIEKVLLEGSIAAPEFFA